MGELARKPENKEWPILSTSVLALMDSQALTVKWLQIPAIPLLV